MRRVLEHATAMQKMIKNATTVIVPDAGHATMAANEVMYIKVVRDFLSEALR